MTFDAEMILSRYKEMDGMIEKVRGVLNRPLTLAEKILFSHLTENIKDYKRGADYVNFAPDRVAMQDATAQMALLQFMNAGREKVAVPSTVHCDHLILADKNAASDLANAKNINGEVYSFLEAVSNKFGIGFWKPGAGIIHQVVLENYSFPGGMMIGTDSHTPNAGGLGMVAIGVGGADAADVMSGMPWELKMPKIIGIKLTGEMSGWTSAKDVILKLAGILTVKGGTDAILEYFGPGTSTVSATGKATICNMGAEIGATTSIFPYDDKISEYLAATGRREIADAAAAVGQHLKADAEVEQNPEKYYDKVIEINLSELEPYLNGPFTPDAAHPISEFAKIARQNNYPEAMEVGLIGSCTNSSYEDMARAASLARQAKEKGLKVSAELIINPGSEQVRHTAERDGILADFEAIGGKIMANACGPCIGQWKRHTDDPTRPNSILTSFNRNFAARNDGNPSTHAFVTSPEMVIALTIAGKITFNPLTDTLVNQRGEEVRLDPPVGDQLPAKGFGVEDSGYQAPATNGNMVDIVIDPQSERLQLLEPFAAWDGKDYTNLALLIKVCGKCTTDHISAAGPWLRFRGHLQNISDNLLMAAINVFNGERDKVFNYYTGEYNKVSTTAKSYKQAGVDTIVVGEENYGEGSSREHAALEPRFLGVKVVLVKSFARIHETNLKKQGVLALTFADKSDYDKIGEMDTFAIHDMQNFAPGVPFELTINHSGGTKSEIKALHTYNEMQIEWFKAGSALNLLSKKS